MAAPSIVAGVDPEIVVFLLSSALESFKHIGTGGSKAGSVAIGVVARVLHAGGSMTDGAMACTERCCRASFLLLFIRSFSHRPVLCGSAKPAPPLPASPAHGRGTEDFTLLLAASPR